MPSRRHRAHVPLAPRVLDASMGLYREVMFDADGLSRADAELLAVVVSRANGCHY